ncbi:hypothetical protein ACV3Q3_13045 [Clostridium perfringens]
MNKLKLTRNILTGALLIIVGIIIGMLISNHIQNVKVNTKPVAATQQEQNNNQLVRLTKVLTESTEDIKLDPHEVYRELSDNSYSLENDSTKEYTFTPSIMGDWDLKANSKEELKNMILTYIENTNNLNKTIKKPLRITKVLTKSTDEIRLNNGEVYTEFSNDAWMIENYKNNTYELCIPELGDWTYVLHNKSDFDKLVKTYLINVNE